MPSKTRDSFKGLSKSNSVVEEMALSTAVPCLEPSTNPSLEWWNHANKVLQEFRSSRIVLVTFWKKS